MSDSNTRKWAIIGIAVTIAIGISAFVFSNDTINIDGNNNQVIQENSGQIAGGNINIHNPEPLQLKAKITPITAGPYYVGNSIEFSADDSITPQGTTIVNYEWEFEGETKSGLTVNHEFKQSAKHPVALIIQNSNGDSDKTEFPINVSERPPLPPSDMDDDGISDNLDQCPNQKETINGIDDKDGCPDSKPVSNKIIISPGSSTPNCENNNSCYIPFERTINVGNTVLWSNEDAAKHTVTSGDPADGHDKIFDSGLFGPGDLFEYTFAERGTFDYFCQIHPWAEGTVIVK